MKKIFTKFVPLLLVLMMMVTLVSCKSQYPTDTPKVSNGKDSFLTLGSSSITNEQLFNKLVVTNGVAELNNLVDSKLLKDFKISNDEFTKYLNKAIYGVEDTSELEAEELEEKLESFEEEMIQLGFYTKNEYTEYYTLEFKRMKYAKEVLTKEIAEFNEEALENEEDPYFTDKRIEDYYDANYRGDVTSIIITFDSENEAREMMKAEGISTKLLTPTGWENTSGTALTNGEVELAFINMFNKKYVYYGNSLLTAGEEYTTSGTEVNFDLDALAAYDHENIKFNYEYTDLSSISSSIASKVFNDLSTDDFYKSYTIAPKSFGSKFYLALKINHTEEAKDLEEAKEEIIDKLIDSEVNSALINRVMFELRAEKGLEIFHEGLEISFVGEYDKAFATAGVTDYEEYTKTKAESKTDIAKLADGSVITADELFNVLKNKYSVKASVDYMNQYIVLTNEKYNAVYNPFTGSILDQEAYDEAYERDVEAYKEQFESDAFDSLGYGKKYGWDNFIRDYLGASSEKDLLASGSVYSQALANYKTESYDFTKLNAEMQTIADEFYSVKTIAFVGSYDFNKNNIADINEDLTEAQISLAKELTDLAMEKAVEAKGNNATEKKLTAVVNDIVKDYKLATVASPVWGKYKAAGLSLSVETKDYNSNSVVSEEIGTALKAIWDSFEDATSEDSQYYKYLGKTLDTYSTDLGKYLQPIYLDAMEGTSGVYTMAVTGTTDKIHISKSSINPRVLPTEQEIETYIIIKKPNDEKTDEEKEYKLQSVVIKSIEKYYVEAKNNLESSKTIDKLIIAEREGLLDANTFKFADSNIKANYDRALEIILAGLED